MEDRLEQEFATYEQALALKELGFDKWCFLYWYKSEAENLLLRIHDHIVNNTKCVPAPLKQQVFRWFREKYGLGHNIEPYSLNAHIIELNGVEDDDPREYSIYSIMSYEEAENACIDKLIELTKQNKQWKNYLLTN